MSWTWTRARASAIMAAMGYLRVLPFASMLGAVASCTSLLGDFNSSNGTGDDGGPQLDSSMDGTASDAADAGDTGSTGDAGGEGSTGEAGGGGNDGGQDGGGSTLACSLVGADQRVLTGNDGGTISADNLYVYNTSQTNVLALVKTGSPPGLAYSFRSDRPGDAPQVVQLAGSSTAANLVYSARSVDNAHTFVLGSDQSSNLLLWDLGRRDRHRRRAHLHHPDDRPVPGHRHDLGPDRPVLRQRHPEPGRDRRLRDARRGSALPGHVDLDHRRQRARRRAAHLPAQRRQRVALLLRQRHGDAPEHLRPRRDDPGVEPGVPDHPGAAPVLPGRRDERRRGAGPAHRRCRHQLRALHRGHPRVADRHLRSDDPEARDVRGRRGAQRLLRRVPGQVRRAAARDRGDGPLRAGHGDGEGRLLPHRRLEHPEQATSSIVACGMGVAMRAGQRSTSTSSGPKRRQRHADLSTRPSSARIEPRARPRARITPRVRSSRGCL